MERYYVCNNNGVTAIVSEETYKDMKKHRTISLWFDKCNIKKSYEERELSAMLVYSALKHLCVPIFTFTNPEREKSSPWFTGDTIILVALMKHIKDNVGIIENGSFYVPFSNGCETGLHGKESMKYELSYVTTEKQFRDAFGISISELIHEE